MDVPLNTDVECADGSCGRSTYVVIDPNARQVTHVVVKETRWPFTMRLVPIEEILETTLRVIRLRCTQADLARFEAFLVTEFIPVIVPGFSEYYGSSYMMGGAPQILPVQEEHIPAGELALEQGAHVAATDGRVGRVDEFLIDPADGCITHLVMRTGHLWGQRIITVPVSAIDRIEEDWVYLKLDKHAVGALPGVLLHQKAG